MIAKFSRQVRGGAREEFIHHGALPQIPRRTIRRWIKAGEVDGVVLDSAPFVVSNAKRHGRVLLHLAHLDQLMRERGK